MNFFFGFKNNKYFSELQIPKFKNRYPKESNLSLFEADIYKKKWRIKKLDNLKENKYFFFLNNNFINNEKIFFLAKDDQVKNTNTEKLINYNNFTDTSPAYRSNLKVCNLHEGFSSYQSEYPYEMIKKKGSILSSVSVLANKEADKNFLIFRNIFIDPIHDEIELYFINIQSKKILQKKTAQTNKSNIIEIEKEFIHPEVYILSRNYTGIPIYLSEKNGHLSFEHTHPPHEYIMSENKFNLVNKLKYEAIEIIN